MKPRLLLFLGLITSTSLFAQTPQGISHQAVMRDAENKLVVESPIGLQVSILQGAHDGNAVYVETHNVMTNQHGLITYVIGYGDVAYGVFEEIDWSDGPYWLETKADPDGGDDYSITGVTQFFNVPYSMYSEFAGHAETFTGLDALLARIEALEEALETVDPSIYNLHLLAYPPYAGAVNGYGEYQEGDEVIITAIANEGWEFVNWSGDTEHLDDNNAETATVNMPADEIMLTANFEQVGLVYGDGVTDIDDNHYVTVIIGDQEWMAENLRVTRYNNSDNISTGLSNADWESTLSGAYAVYDHTASNTDGIDSPAEMVEAYGKLYNWHAVNDERGLCPTGWYVPSDDDWTQLVNYVVDQGFANYDITNGTGNALKSCRQVDSPLGPECDTFEHPRWDSEEWHHGLDVFGFSALPSGFRSVSDGYFRLGEHSTFWSASDFTIDRAWFRFMRNDEGNVSRNNFNKNSGYTIRCVREL